MSAPDATLAWEKMGGLLPAVVQDADTLQVLMLGYMSAEALQRTRATGRVTFQSRSRGGLWTKGETSGHFLELVDVVADCDGDALLVTARPRGPTCHRETTSCFGTETAPGVGFLQHVARVIADRAEKRPEGSYTVKLLDAGLPRVAQKVGEEAVETVIAALGEDRGAMAGEVGDLLYHLLVLLKARGASLEDALSVLRARRG
jgi:phosphoribosyl-ATP pyrophosphohydrolase/phosphoribosyl-AMP cyclohydrolase